MKDDLLYSMFSNSSLPMLLYSDCFIDANAAALFLFNMSDSGELLEKIDSLIPDDVVQNRVTIKEMLPEAIKKGSVSLEVVFKVDEKELYTSLTITYISDGGDVLFLITITDLSKIKKTEKALRNAEKEIMIGNQEVIIANIELERQKDEVTEQKNELEKKNNAITSSLHYARRIQNALLPPDKHIAEILPDNFVLYRPRDIVSGDFYWIERVDDKIVIAVADCTGHGVPGAFMSMLGLSYLFDVVYKLQKKKELYAHNILNELREKVKSTMRQTGSVDDRKDGMDMALCVINPKKQELEFAGAYHPMLLVRGDELITYKGDPMPISVFHKEQPFTSETIKLKQNDTIYMYSDGFMDQFGKKNNKKYGKRQFRELLHATCKLPINQQKKTLINELDQWQLDKEQLDDILVVGVQFDFNKIENTGVINAYEWSTKTLLIAEDDEFAFIYLQDLLSITEVNIIQAITGNEAIDKFIEHQDKIDAVLMDLDLPELSGYDAIREIKKIKAHVPVIVQTAFIFKDEKKAYDAGCNDYITKPVDIDILFRLLGKYF